MRDRRREEGEYHFETELTWVSAVRFHPLLVCEEDPCALVLAHLIYNHHYQTVLVREEGRKGGGKGEKRGGRQKTK